jgi:hypothetical protein
MRYLNQLKIIILLSDNNYEIVDDMMKQREGTYSIVQVAFNLLPIQPALHTQVYTSTNTLVIFKQRNRGDTIHDIKKPS